jgi:hypothetical protein
MAPPVGGNPGNSPFISYSLMRERSHERMIRDPSAIPSPKYKLSTLQDAQFRAA